MCVYTCVSVKSIEVFYRAWEYQDTGGEQVTIHMRSSYTCMHMCVCTCLY